MTNAGGSQQSSHIVGVGGHLNPLGWSLSAQHLGKIVVDGLDGSRFVRA